MNIVFNAVSNCLTRLDENLVTAYSQVTAEFYFTSEWYGLSRKTAVFSCNGNVYYAILNVDNIADVPPECLTNDVQSFTVSVFGDNLITTNEVVVNVTTSSDGSEDGETRLDITDKNIIDIFDNSGDVKLEQVENLEDPTVNKYKLEFTDSAKEVLDSKAEISELEKYYTKDEIDSKNYLSEVPSNYITDSKLDNKLDEYQTKLDFDSIPTAGSQNPVTSDGLNQAISGKQDKIGGASGEILYHSGTGVFSQSIMNEGSVVLTEEDLEISESNVLSFLDVFNNWRRFSHYNGSDNAVSSELNGWKYDASLDTVVMPTNTVSYCGFVSPSTYSEYNNTVRLYSSGQDNDTIGLVAAFAVDENGKEHTLSFLRTCGDPGATWICKVDYCTFQNTLTSYNQITLVDKSSTALSKNKANWSASSVGVGTVINMTRKGNVFTAKCSQYNSTVLDNNTTITIDLDQLSSKYPVLNLFKGSSSWGYSTYSQPYSKYENLDVNDPNSLIYDLTNNTVKKYNARTKNWEVIPNTTPVKEIGAGRFSFNKNTGKLFYCNGYTVYQVAKI